MGAVANRSVDTRFTRKIPMIARWFCELISLAAIYVAAGSNGWAETSFHVCALWGVGQRIFFLLDGRTADLLVAIQAHANDGRELYFSS